MEYILNIMIVVQGQNEITINKIPIHTICSSYKTIIVNN